MLVIEDALGYICHYQVLDHKEDDHDVLTNAMTILQERVHHRIRRGSFDRGFHSKENQLALSGPFIGGLRSLCGAGCVRLESLTYAVTAA